MSSWLEPMVFQSDYWLEFEGVKCLKVVLRLFKKHTPPFFALLYKKNAHLYVFLTIIMDISLQKSKKQGGGAS